MRFPGRLLALIGALIVAAATLAACGGGVPGNAVVSIGGDAIKKDTFEQYLPVAYKRVASQQPGTPPNVPVPPDFKRCIADLKKAQPEPKKGQPRPSDATLKAQCKQLYDGARDSVMQYFIQSAWFIGEAKDRGIELSDEQVKKEFEKQRKTSFPTPAAFQQFLKQSGFTMENLLFQVKVTTLQQKLQKKVLSGADKVSAAQIKSYYDKNKSQFAQPEQRSLRIVMTKDKGKADQAKKAIESGQSWKSVAKKYSIDESTKASGGLLPNVPEGQQEKTLDKATFAAKKGQLGGPVKTQFGYYVFEVDKITEGSQQSLKEATPMIKQTLISQNQQKKIQAFSKDFEKKWKERTECAKGYIIASCKNAPKPKKGDTTATTVQQQP